MKAILMLIFTLLPTASFAAERLGSKEDVQEAFEEMSQIISAHGIDALVDELSDNASNLGGSRLGLAVLYKTNGKMIVGMHNKYSDLAGYPFHDILDLRGQNLLNQIKFSANNGGEQFSNYFPHYETEVEYEYLCYGEWVNEKESLLTVCH